MKVLSIIDSFKGTLTSNELGQIASLVFKNKGFESSYFPISDGGDGFLDCLENIKKCRRVDINIKNPLFVNTNSYYIVDEDNVAYIEMAKSSGINMVPKHKMNPMLSSTYGLGQMIKDAIIKGHKTIFVGLGGSATNDAGVGMMESLGAKFLDSNGQVIENTTPLQMEKISDIYLDDFYELTKDIKFVILSDVVNPFLGQNGASYVFSPQKGANKKMVNELENIMYNYSNLVKSKTKIDKTKSLGAGAAGGIGYAFHTFFETEFKNGINSLLDMIGFNNISNEYDFIVTGEGKIDKQSLGGKVIQGILEKNTKSKIILVCAINELKVNELSKYNIHSCYSIVNMITDEKNSKKYPHKYFRELCESIKF